jgi:hypothetical protein
MPDQEVSSRRIGSSYLVTRVAVILEFVRWTLFKYFEWVQTVLGVDTRWNYVLKYFIKDSHNRATFLTQKGNLIERCLCLQPTNPGTTVPVESTTIGSTSNKEGKSFSIDLWELRELALSEGGLLNGAGSCHRTHTTVYVFCLVVSMQQILFCSLSLLSDA